MMKMMKEECFWTCLSCRWKRARGDPPAFTAAVRRRFVCVRSCPLTLWRCPLVFTSSSTQQRRAEFSGRFLCWPPVYLKENVMFWLDEDLVKKDCWCGGAGNWVLTLLGHPELAAVCRDRHTLILYPGSDAENLEELDRDFTTTPHNVIIIDGTWSQAKDMFLRNTLFRLPKQVQLNSAPSSQYVIRTQPTNMCLSTLECAAVTLSIMERNQAIQEVLLRPLRALCSFQLQHGAQVHHSKEHLLKNGLYDKPMPKNKRKIKRMQKLITNQNI
ncbi:tRNA-uridine aminocarboxypropyltransferase 2 isoform X2 [Hoplias malabaricus]|uniref:tRNA-uridine aminocarboxypropyltransferase 2 isoform X2 n=1 Tax=Hoplias malabaricus TaxID=27720 RepID=UPI003462BADC